MSIDYYDSMTVYLMKILINTHKRYGEIPTEIVLPARLFEHAIDEYIQERKPDHVTMVAHRWEKFIFLTAFGEVLIRKQNAEIQPGKVQTQIQRLCRRLKRSIRNVL